MNRLTSRLAAAGVLALGLILATSLASALPASASARVARPAAPVTAQPAGTAQVSLKPLPGQRVTASPDIEEESCTASRDHWVHIYTDDDGTLCFGYAGTAYFDVPPEINEFCAGNNYGQFELYNETNGDYSIVDYPSGWGLDYPNLILIVYVSISGWTGSATC